jgi:hypothetical protein
MKTGIAPNGVYLRHEKDVEDILVWAFRDHRVLEVLQNTAPVAQLGYGIDSTSKCQRVAELGALTDYSGKPSQDLPPDVETVHDAVMRMRNETHRALVIAHARIGERPDAMKDAAPRWRKMINRRGTQAHEYDRNGRAIACWIEWDVTYHQIEFTRRVYSMWHAALQTVAHALRSDLTLNDFVVTGPAAPAQPWT